MAYADGTFTSPKPIGRGQVAFPFAFLADQYARNTQRRFQQLGANYVGNSVAVRTSATNLVNYSEQFDNAAWTAGAVNVFGNFTASPWFGTVTASIMLETTANSAHYVSQNFTASAAAYTASVFVKYANRTWGYLQMTDSAAVDHRVFFNPLTGAIGSNSSITSANISSAANGWYRIRVTASVAAGAVSLLIGSSTADGTTVFVGNGSAGLYLWGAQAQQSSSVTAYVPTTNGNATASCPATDETDANPSPDPLALLVEESAPSEGMLDLGTCEFTRVYARIPNTQVQYSSRFVTRPVMDDVYSGSNYAVSFDNGVTSSRFVSGSRFAISAIGTAPPKTITYVAAAIDSWPIGTAVTIRGNSNGVQSFFTSSPADTIRTLCNTGTGLNVGVVKSETAITISVISGQILSLQCSDANVTVGGSAGSSSITLERKQVSNSSASEGEASSVRSFTTGSAHGGSAGQQIVFWKGNQIVGRSVASTASGSSLTCPIADVPGSNFTADYVAFAPQAAARYVNGVKNCSIKRSTYFYLPGYTTNIATGADIPNYPIYTDPVSWLGQLVAAANYSAVEVSAIDFWMGPIYQQTVDEVQMSDAIDTVTP